MTNARFEPIAIVGQGCVIPGCFTPSGLWNAVRNQRSLLTPPTPDVWGLAPEDYARQPFQSGGFVRGFDKRFVPDEHDLGDLDPMDLDHFVRWLLQAGADAWRDSGDHDRNKGRTAVIVANLAYPSRGLTDYAADLWMDGKSDRPAIQRFSAGFPAMALARRVRASGTRFCLDAACASSLYALWLSCMELQFRRADQVLCAALNGVDNLFLHQGFKALNAISPTGRSRPLVDGADGLVPSEGAAAVVLRRLGETTESDHIHGVIRGIGLSNDGRRKGLLAPDGDGQSEAIRRAYKAAGLDPQTAIGLLECHATGTPVGDGVELAASNAILTTPNRRPLPVGSVKSNTGHLITVAGLASVLKLTGAFRHGVLPPTRIEGEPHSIFGDLSLVPQTSLAPWPAEDPMRAGLSTFGFGGNNAHLVLEAPNEADGRKTYAVKHPDEPIVICGVGALAGPDRGVRAITRRLMRARDAGLTRTEEIDFDAKAARTPPADLLRAESQQLAVLDVTTEALQGVTPLAPERTGCIVAMNCAPDAARWMLRERLATRFAWPEDATQAAALKDAIAPDGSSADVLGAMPNMPANRVNVREDWRGLGFTVACEHQSGEAALAAAFTALQAGILDMAVVAAAEFASDPICARALSGIGAGSGQTGDAAVALVLKRKSQAERDGDTILAAIPRLAPVADTVSTPAMDDRIVQMYGNSHAAGSLLSIGMKAVLRSRSLALQGDGIAPRIEPMTPHETLGHPAPDIVRGGATLFWCAGQTIEDLTDAARAGRPGGEGPVRLAVIAPTGRDLDQRLEYAVQQLEQGCGPEGEGIAFSRRNRSCDGDLAFVFTGSASNYPQASRGLFMAFPELGSMLAARSPHIHILGPLLSKPNLTPFEDLCCGVLTSQAQALLLGEWFGLRPDAAIGLSLGETNALIAFGAWRDAEVLLNEIARGEMYERHLGGRFEVLAPAWHEKGAIPWQNWQISGPLQDVREAVDREPFADITIIYSETECLIGGHPEACDRIARALGHGRAIATGHDFVVHTAFMGPYRDAWRRYHTRKTYRIPDIRFYSNGRDGPYAPSEAETADALTRQACRTIDFPKTIRRAYADGVRTFVEIGSRDVLAQSIGTILGSSEHIAVALDRSDRPDIMQLSQAMAELWVIGYDIPIAKLSKRLSAIEKNAWKPRTDAPTVLKRPAHKPSPDRPKLPKHPRPDAAPTKATPARATLDGPPRAPALPPLTPIERVRVTKSATRTATQSPPSPAFTQPNPANTNREQKPARSGRTAPLAFCKPRPKPLDRHAPKGPAFGRDQIEQAAEGPISELFGHLFSEQDPYERQVRLPAPPLLLVDRITGIDAEPTVHSRGRIWTETDVDHHGWALHAGRMRPGPLIESGQADLSLISYMGADFENRSERVYRLLGCEFSFQNGPMPRAGETLSYQIEITGHARTGDVRLFFFQYDCHIGDRLLLSVRNGQAGFFTDDELAQTKGILWSPDHDAAPTTIPETYEPTVVSQKRSFSAEDLNALRNGDTLSCFGDGFELAAPQSRPPTLPGGALALIDDVPEFSPNGGPWQRGYLCARSAVPTSAWFYDGHFHNDPCMPGTLMVEAALQALEFFAMGIGMTVERDGFLFEPSTAHVAKFECRGQVVPDRDHEITYEVFIDEIVDGDTPRISAALLATCDGTKVFHCERISLELKRAWPAIKRDAPARMIGPDASARGDQTSLLACADGAPSEAFGDMYSRFDAESRVPRLPRPPFHFMSMIEHVSTPAGAPEQGAEVRSRFNVDPDAWYFTDGGTGRMPFAILSEILLQPCGWLASHCGFATDGGAYFRNLDGDLEIASSVEPNCGYVTVVSKLTAFSKAGPVTIVRFKVSAATASGEPIATLDTSFGFFNKAAFAKQTGVRMSGPFEGITAENGNRPKAAIGAAQLPRNKLRMIHDVDYFDPTAGSTGLGAIRGQHDVDPYAWYFQAHFFQDPVQPGSLGIGGMVELLTDMALRRTGLGQNGPVDIVTPAPGIPLQWKCRGQVTPDRQTVTTVLDVQSFDETDEGITVSAAGLLICDGLPIYEASGISVRLRKSI